MRAAKWTVVVAGVIAGAAACGGSSSGGSASLAPAAGGGTVASSGGGAAKVTVETMQQSPYGTILTTSDGRSLYLYTEDSKGSSSCAGGCVSEWPPLVAPAGARVSGVKGLDTITRPDGSHQVALNGLPLYTFAGDSSAGQVSGQGEDGDWFVATPSGASHATAAPAATTSSGGGYSY